MLVTVRIGRIGFDENKIITFVFCDFSNKNNLKRIKSIFKETNLIK
jgi:hypothetical protein